MRNFVPKKKLQYYLNRVALLYVFSQADIGAAAESEQITQLTKVAAFEKPIP